MATATATATPAPTTTVTPCKFAGMMNRLGKLICPADTIASHDVQIGGPDQSRVEHMKTCKACATRMSGVREKRMEEKRAGKLPNDEVLDVIVCNSGKVEFFAHAARHDGAGLESRMGGDRKMRCSGKNWDGGPCPLPLKGMAVAYHGVKFDLCGSCETAAKLVAVRDKNELGRELTPLISPIASDLAAIRAKRQTEAMAAATKKKPAAAPKAAEPPVDDDVISFEAFILATRPAQARGTETLEVVRHLNE